MRPERKISGAFHLVLCAAAPLWSVEQPNLTLWVSILLSCKGKNEKGGEIHRSELESCCGIGAIMMIKNKYS